MRQLVKDFVQICAEEVAIEDDIFEFGALNVEGQEGFADLRSLFPGRTYVGTDMREGCGVDRVLDLHRLDLPDRSVGTAICVETLEHVQYPHTAVEEIFRTLKPDGVAIISSVLNFPIHDYPSDYWRFTPEAMHCLLRQFGRTIVAAAGHEAFPHTVVAIGFKTAPSEAFVTNLRERLQAWATNWVDAFSGTQALPHHRTEELQRLYDALLHQHQLDATEYQRVVSREADHMRTIESLQSQIEHLEEEKNFYASRWNKLLSFAPINALYRLRHRGKRSDKAHCQIE